MTRALAAALLCACTVRVAQPTKPMAVSITQWPPVPFVICTLPTLPNPPEAMIPWRDDDEAFARMSVHRRDFEGVLNYLHLVGLWSAQVNICIDHMRERF